MDRHEYEEILTYLSKSKYPEGIRTKDIRSNFRKKCRPFTYCKDKLYYNHKKYGALEVVKGAREKRLILHSCHIREGRCSILRHHGINRTLKNVSTKYYWKTIAKDVHNLIKEECQTCIEKAAHQNNVMNSAMMARSEAEGKIRIKSKELIVDKAIEQIGLDMIGHVLEPSVPSPQETVCSDFKCESVVSRIPMQEPVVPRDHIITQCGLDIVGPLHETHSGKKYIVILTDCVTKWVEGAAIAEFTSGLVGNFLIDNICRLGTIEEITTKHNHNNFCNRLIEKINSLLHQRVQMSVFAPPSQCNGYLGNYWYNSLLCSALIKYSNEYENYWDIYLQPAIQLYRNFHQKDAPMSPFRQIYARKTNIPALGMPPLNSDGYTDDEEALGEHMVNYIKDLNDPLALPSISMDTQPQERLMPAYMDTDNLLTTPATPMATVSTTLNQQGLRSFTHTIQGNNQIQTNIPLSSQATTLQQNTENRATIYAIPSNGVTAQSISTSTIASQTLPTNSMTTQNIQNCIATPGITAQGLQGSTITQHNIPNNSHILTTPPVTPVTSQVLPAPTSVVNTSTVQTATNITSQANTESPSMVMIHTDGKAYMDSFYVICSQ